MKPFYTRDELDVASKFTGGRRVPRSGAGEFDKLDDDTGRSLISLKSVEKAESVSLKLKDWKECVYHARRTGRIPVMAYGFDGGFKLAALNLDDYAALEEELKEKEAEITNLKKQLESLKNGNKDRRKETKNKSGRTLSSTAGKD